MIDINPDLLAFLREEETRSRNEDLLDRAEVCLRAYNGEPYGDEEEGRSQVVTRDVAEVIDHMEVSVLRTFVSGDKVVEFEPDSSEMAQAADDATETIDRQFSRKGYQLLHDWFKEGNISVLGIVKTVAERKRKRVEFQTLDPEGEGAIEADVIAEVEGITLYNAVRLEEGEVQFKDYLVPLEEFRVSPDTRDLDDAAYVAHATPKMLSELVEMGFDKEAVEGIQGDPDIHSELGSARDDHLSMWGGDRKGALRKVILMEEYVRFDADGDGIAELLCIHRVGSTILKVEPIDYQPFVIYCPFPMPGRLAGHSLAEKVTDIQRVRTVLRRLHLDGLYCNLAPGYIVGDSAVNENTYDDLLTVRPNRIIRAKIASEIKPENKNDVSPAALAALESMTGERESRTGITRLNQGLDADALNKTATGTALMQAQGQQMEEYLARNFAEAVARLMRLKLKLLARYGKPMEVRVDGQFRTVDPSQWPEDMDVAIRVGLGSGKKETRLQNRMMLLQIQRECMMAGLPIVGPDEVYRSIAGLVRDASLGSPADFVIDPATIPPPEGPPPPSPEEQKVQAEAQLQAAKMQGEQEMAAIRLQTQREEAALKIELARDEAAAQLDLARAKAAAELQLARDKFAVEAEMAQQRADHEARHRHEEEMHRHEEAKISQNRSGGDLDK